MHLIMWDRCYSIYDFTFDYITYYIILQYMHTKNNFCAEYDVKYNWRAKFMILREVN